LAFLAGCSKDEEAAAPKETEAAEKKAAETEQQETAPESGKDGGEEAPETEASEESSIPEAALHNVEEIVKEKGKYVSNEMTEEQKEQLVKDVESAPEGMTGEEAYSFAVSLFAAD